MRYHQDSYAMTPIKVEQISKAGNTIVMTILCNDFSLNSCHILVHSN